MDPGNKETLKNTAGAREVYAQLAETDTPHCTDEELKALAVAYAKYLAEHELVPGDVTFTDEEDSFSETEPAAETVEVEKTAEIEETEEVIEAVETEESDEAIETTEVEELAEETEIAEAEEPAEVIDAEESVEETEITEVEGSTETAETEEPAEVLETAEVEASVEVTEAAETEEKPVQTEPSAEKSEPKPVKKAKKARKSAPFTDGEPDEDTIRSIEEKLEKRAKKRGVAAVVVDAHDKIQDKIDSVASDTSREFIVAGHKIISSYRQSRRVIGIALLLIGVTAGLILAIFDKYTVYEYSYNGRVLGYVSNQDDVTDVLEIAGTKLTENNPGRTEIKFTANQNVTFNTVDARGKSTDDSDTAVNKLVYMTDIETEAFAVYDGDDLKAIVKSEAEAETLLNETMAVLSEPDEGMKLVSAEFTNDLSIQPITVALTSVQSRKDALKTMTEGGSVEIYHIIEDGESLTSMSKTYGVETLNIYDEMNENVVTAIEQGDTVCIHKEVLPVSVKMVEKGRMKEVLEFETIKKDSDEYYEGDIYIEQEGVDGIQIFEGTVTKIGGEVTDRKEDNIDVIREKKDKIILVGTAERPRTAPTGTYIVPLNNYVLTSNFGYRWGRLHAGIDMGAPTGTPIYATDGGTVTKSEYYSGYGNVVYIQHENGRETRYGHCSKLLVNYGDKVYQGQLIALVGNTGHSFGSHLHFEIRFNDTPVDPRPYLGI